MKTIELASEIKGSLAVLNTVKITSRETQPLTLEVASDFAGSAPRIRAVKLLPVASGKYKLQKRNVPKR